MIGVATAERMPAVENGGTDRAGGVGIAVHPG